MLYRDLPESGGSQKLERNIHDWNTGFHKAWQRFICIN